MGGVLKNQEPDHTARQLSLLNYILITLKWLKWERDTDQHFRKINLATIQVQESSSYLADTISSDWKQEGGVQDASPALTRDRA